MAQARPNSGKFGEGQSFYARSKPPKKRKKQGKRFSQKRWSEKRRKVYERDKGSCQSPHCAHLGDWTLELCDAEIDHIIPISLNGKNTMPNLRTLCQRCHALRDEPSHYLLRLRRIEDGKLPFNYLQMLW